VDCSAHKGALSSAAGATIGVRGCGIDVIYPKENKRIFAEMEMRGAIISEFTMGTFPGPQEFSDSQSRHRGDVAGCDGRRRRATFRPTDHRAPRDEFGPNQLIKQGAKLITGWEDVIEELPTSVRAELLPGETATSEQRALLVEESLAPAELSFYNLLTQHEPCHVDERVERSGLTSSGVLASLFDLELKGVVRQLPGKQFLKVLL
jgi:DNA processing protein